MRNEEGTYQQTRDEAQEQAKSAFRDHVITVEGPGRWRCNKPGTWIYGFRVITAPGAIVEPLLERVDLTRYLWTACRDCGGSGLFDGDGGGGGAGCACNCARYGHSGVERRNALGWIVIGGESGPGARPYDAWWARDLLRQCAEAGVPAFHKQLGAHTVDSNLLSASGIDVPWPSGTRTAPGYPPRIVLKDRAGGDPEEWPVDLRVRQFPEARR